MPFRTVRHPLLSMWQSAIAQEFRTFPNVREDVKEATADYCEIAFRRLQDGEAGEEISFDALEPALRETGPRALLSYVSGAYHHFAMALSEGDFDAASAMQAKLRPFEEGIGNWHQWYRCSVEYAKYVRRVHSGPMYRSPEFDGHLMKTFSVVDGVLRDDDVRIALVGDWGTGEPVAVQVLDGIVKLEPDLLIHLGDVYTSGTNHEAYALFYDLIRTRKNAATLPVFVLAGNHDYYAGGEGFYQLIDHLNDQSARQAASYFCLRNAHWQVLAMDTGYKDANPNKVFLKKLITIGTKGFQTSVRDDEFRWHKHQLEQTDERATILLSHHQLFSAYDPIGVTTSPDSMNTHLKQRFSPYFSTQSGASHVRAWFWGHEHDFVPMATGHHGLDLGVCMGHGAIPVDSIKVQRPGIPPFNGRDPYTPFKALGTDAGGYYNHGFSMLHLEKRKATIEHFEVDEHGAVLSLFAQPI
jgi:hypothetical protein